MASAYGYTKQVSGYISPYDTDTLTQLALYKQDKYDTNAQFINEQISQIAQIDLFKDVDQQYLNNRLQTITNQLSATGADLSSTAIASNIRNRVMSAIDDNVKQAIDSTSRARKDMLAVEQAREANDGTYNIVNAAYTMSAVQEWASSPFLTTRNSRYQGYGYTPFIDVEGELDKLVSEYTKQRGSTTIDTEVGGYIVRKTVANWTDQELRAYVENNITPDLENQMKINGWYKYGNSGDDGVRNALYGYASGKDDMYTSQIGLGEIVLQNLTGDDRIVAEAQLASLRNAQIGFRNGIANLADNPDNAKLFLEREGIVESLVNKYAPLESLSEIKKNDAYFSAERLKLDWQKFEFEKYKYNQEQARAAAATSGSGTVGTTPADGFNIYGSPIPTDAVSFLDKKDAVINSITTSRQSANNAATELERILTTPNADIQLSEYTTGTDGLTVADIYNSTYNQVRSELMATSNDTPDPTEIRLATLTRIFEDDRSDIIRNASPSTLSLIQNFKSSWDDYERKADVYSKQIQSATAGALHSPANIYNNLLSSRDTQSNIYIPELGGSIRSILEQYGVNSAVAYEEFVSNNPEVARSIDTAVTTYGIISGIDSVARQSDQVQQTGADFLVVPNGETYDRIRLFVEPVVQQLANITGEPVSFDTLFESRQNSNGTLSINGRQTGNSTIDSVINELTSFSYQNETITSGYQPFFARPQYGTTIRNSALGQTVNRFSDYYFGPENQLPGVEAAYDNLYGNLGQNYAFQIYPQTEEATQELISILQLRGADEKTGKPVTPSSDKPVTYQLDPDNPGGVILTQELSTYKNDGGVVPKRIVARVGIGELPQGVIEQINPNPAGSGAFVGAPVPLRSAGNYLSTNEDSNLISYYEDNGVSANDIQLLTYSGTYQYLQRLDAAKWLSSDIDGLLRDGQITEAQYGVVNSLRTGIDDILTDPSIIQVGTHRNNNRTVIDIKIGDFKTSIDTQQRGEGANRLEAAILSNRLLGLSTVLGSLISRAQIVNQNQVAGSNSDLITLNRIIDAFRSEKNKRGVVVSPETN